MCVYYISDEKIKTTMDQVTTQSNIPVSNFALLNSMDSLAFQFLRLLLGRKWWDTLQWWAPIWRKTKWC